MSLKQIVNLVSTRDKVNEDRFLHGLYKLSYLVCGKKSYLNFIQESNNHLFKNLYDDYFLDDVFELLFHVAMQARIYDETYDYFFETINTQCGLVSHNQEKSEALLLRQACNKILHCKIHYFLNETDDHLYLCGLQGSDLWEVNLDILAFVGACLVAIDKDKHPILENKLNRLKSLETLSKK
ncbi:MAG: hypothetical protein AB7P76_09185 [Candidatus Melainabacteria bacterium]